MIRRRAAALFTAPALNRAVPDHVGIAQYDGSTIGFDFAVAEESGRYHECASYIEHYGSQVIAIESRSRDFRWTCSHVGDRSPGLLRHRDLSPTGAGRWC